MLTYQLQRRLYKITNAKPFSFPSDVEVEVCLEPSEQFGVGNRPGRTAVQAHKASGVYNANTGRGKILSDPPLQPIQAGILWEPHNLQYNLNGNILRAKVVCETFEDLELLMVTVHYAVPILLNLEFAL